MSCNYALVFGNQIIPLQLDLKLANKLGTDICHELFSNKKYDVKSDISSQSFQTFLEFINEKNLDISISASNYYDYYQLNEEFNKILDDNLSKPEFEEMKKAAILKVAISDKNTNKKLCVQYIAEHLDYYLEFYEEEVSKIPITTLYNIFQHEKRVLNNQEKAYQFIKSILNENTESVDDKKRTICVLLGTLDGNKISEESLTESISKRDEHFGFSPRIDTTFIKSFNESISELKCQMEQKYETSFKEMLNQQQQIFNEMRKYYDSKINLVQSKYECLLEETKETKNDIKLIVELIKNIGSSIGQIKEENGRTHDTIQDITNKFEATQLCIQQNAEKIKFIEESAKQILSMDNKIQSITDQIDELKTSNLTVTKKCDSTYNCIQHIPDKITNIENKVNENLNNMMSISNAKLGLFRGIIRELTIECGGNVSDKGIVIATSSSCYNNRYAKLAMDLDNYQTLFGSNDIENSWLKYDFINMKVRPTHYIIRSRDAVKGHHHPKSWVVEGSNSDALDSWVVLDVRNNIASLDGNSFVQIFSIQKVNDYYRYLRIRQTSKNTKGAHFFEISALDYFVSVQ